MAESFYTILTKIGKAKIANAHALGTKVNITTMTIGDGNGAYYNPTEEQTTLKHEVWRGNVNLISTDVDNPNWIVIETVLTAEIGGFVVREVGIMDDQGDLLAIGKYPETYKPVLASGSAKDLHIRMILEVTNASTVTLKVDPSVILATKKYVDDKVEENSNEWKQHTQNTNIHVTQTEKNTWNKGKTDLDTHVNRKDNPHNVTASQIGAETPAGAQTKANTAETSAKNASVPRTGGTMTGPLTAQNNTSYTTKQVRNIILSTSDPTGGDNGDIWIKYKA